MDTVALLATPLAILGLINLAKGLGLPTTLAAPLAVVLGVALGLADRFLGGIPGYVAAADGLLLGLGAVGLYDATKTTLPRRAEGE